MYKRIFDIENRLDEGMFLFGGRQVGKSTLLRERFPKAIYVDLLDPDRLTCKVPCLSYPKIL